MAERVLQLLGPSTGGIRRVAATLDHGLRARGWDVLNAGPAGVLAGLAPQHADVSLPLGVGRVRRLSHDVDVVHAHGLKAGWTAWLARPRAPVVVTVHNLVLDAAAGRAAPLLRAVEGRLPRAVGRVIAVSPEIAARFGGAATVVPPATEAPTPTRPPAEVRASYDIGPDEHLVVSVARLHPQKDLGTLLAAIAALSARLPGVRLLIVGEGPDEQQLRRRAAELGLGGVVFAGGRPSAADELAAADVVAISSRWESGPLVLLEAMQLGRPVVATAVGLVPSLVTDRVTGRLVPVGDPAAMADALAEVLADRALATSLGAAGQAAVDARHGPEAMVAATEAVYREVLA